LKYFEKYDWIIGATSYESVFEDGLGQELLRWVDNVPLPPEHNLIVLDYDGLILSYSDSSLIGRNINEEGFDLALRDELSMVINQTREKGKGIVRFSLPDYYNDEQVIDCIAYFRGLNKWKWVIVNWVNSSVLDAELKGLQNQLIVNVTKQMKKVFGISLALLMAILILALVISKKFSTSINSFLRFFSQASTSSVEIDPSAQPFTELAKMARAANSMISQRLEAEQRVADSEVKFRTVFDVSPQIITIMDKDGHLLEANDQFELYVNRTLEEAKGVSLAKLLDIPSQIWTKFLNDLRTDITIEGQELQVKDSKGRPVYLLLFGKLMSYKDNDVVLGVCVDITELRLAEQEKLELKEKLSRSQRMESMGLMAASVAHELNNILSGLIGYPELLLRDDSLTTSQRTQVQDTLDAGHRASEVVSDMMTLAKGVATAKLSVNLIEVIEKSLSSSQVKMALSTALYGNQPSPQPPQPFSTFVPSGQPIKIEFDKPKKPLFIKGSPRHLLKAIQHLVVNAIEAFGPGQETGTKGPGLDDKVIETEADQPLIKVSVEEVNFENNPGYFDTFKAGVYAKVTISDNGPGIPPGDIARIFEPFYTKKSRTGRGLGLAVVDLIVKSHGGGLEVESSPNGTTFNIYLKASTEAAKVKAAPNVGKYLGQGEKILIVDDVDIQRKLAQKILKTLGYDPYSVSSGEEAVEFLKGTDVDLVILDMIMDPGINGRQTYEAILAFKPNQKAIIASGMAENDEVEMAQSLGASYFVSKPYTIEAIAGAVFNALHTEAT
jgi:PAS domain S-box-containing protein